MFIWLSTDLVGRCSSRRKRHPTRPALSSCLVSSSIGRPMGTHLVHKSTNRNLWYVIRPTFTHLVQILTNGNTSCSYEVDIWKSLVQSVNQWKVETHLDMLADWLKGCVKNKRFTFVPLISLVFNWLQRNLGQLIFRMLRWHGTKIIAIGQKFFELRPDKVGVWSSLAYAGEPCQHWLPAILW